MLYCQSQLSQSFVVCCSTELAFWTLSSLMPHWTASTHLTARSPGQYRSKIYSITFTPCLPSPPQFSWFTSLCRRTHWASREQKYYHVIQSGELCASAEIKLGKVQYYVAFASRLDWVPVVYLLLHYYCTVRVQDYSQLALSYNPIVVNYIPTYSAARSVCLPCLLAQ